MFQVVVVVIFLEDTMRLTHKEAMTSICVFLVVVIFFMMAAIFAETVFVKAMILLGMVLCNFFPFYLDAGTKYKYKRLVKKYESLPELQPENHESLLTHHNLATKVWRAAIWMNKISMGETSEMTIKNTRYWCDEKAKFYQLLSTSN